MDRDIIRFAKCHESKPGLKLEGEVDGEKNKPSSSGDWLASKQMRPKNYMNTCEPPNFDNPSDQVQDIWMNCTD